MSEEPELGALVEARYHALVDAARAASVRFHDDAGVDARLKRVLAASDFAFDVLRREPALLGPRLVGFINDPRHAAARAPTLLEENDGDGAAADALRRFRRRESLRLLWRDVAGIAPVEATLAGASELAEVCADAALAALMPSCTARFGTPRGADGAPQSLCVIGMGKLGGAELNFSSDIDLLFAFPEAGQCDGPRALANEDFFARLGQRLIQMLAAVSEEGFAFRVDMRLRPFGNAGRLALSFAAMEQYYQRDGRDWERYAWIKARPVAGDRAAGGRLVAQLRPFVYRRYLDYTAIDGLREMKAMIDAEVARQDLADHIKLGPGGIREIEFIVQLAQLIRGGREPSLRTTSLLEALAALERLGLVRASAARRLREAYRFLRRLENRLQMLRDAQTHVLPAAALDRHRIATGMGYAGFDELAAALAGHRTAVAEEFDETQSAGRARPAPAALDWQRRWGELSTEGGASAQAGGFGVEATAELAAFATGPTVRGLDARARQRLDHLMPLLLEAAAARGDPDATLGRLLRLLQAVAGRTSYLVLLDEQSAARERVVDVFARSAFLAERVIAHPLLLDEMLDARLESAQPDARSMRLQLAADPGEDPEERFMRLHEERHGAAFRLGLAWLAGRLGAKDLAARLAAIAEVVVADVLALAGQDARAQYGAPEGLGADEGMAVIAYGSLGGAELGFASDLDLVFVYDGSYAGSATSGPRSVEGSRYFARVAQRVVHWLTALARTGRLYEVDVRLRPDGAKGLLVTSMEAFAEYQRERAWSWEHQALVRARAIAGDGRVSRRFDEVRREILGRAREPAQVRSEIQAMRERWRGELDRSDGARFDLKQGRGGLVDMEFLLQSLVLQHAAAVPALLEITDTPGLIERAEAAGVLSRVHAAALAAAHESLLGAALGRTLDDAPRLVEPGDKLLAHTARVLEIAATHGLDWRQA